MKIFARKKHLNLYNSSIPHIMWKNFLAGTFNGLGFILGSAIFLALAGFLINAIAGEIPFFSDVAEALNLWLEAAQR